MPPRAAAAPRRRAHRRPVRRAFIVTHRWLSLILGLGLLAVTTSGAILLWNPELERWSNSDAYAASGGPATVGFEQAVHAVTDRYPDVVPDTVIAEHGVLRVVSGTSSVTVDPATGAVLGEVHELPTWWRWLENFHECLLTCDNMPGYLPWLNAPVPGTSWLAHNGEPVSVGLLLLGGSGILLLFLTVSGIVLWWPRRGRWRAAVTVRTGKGRFARDTDLHKVIGMVAVPLLLLWGLTGAGFEFEPVETAWYAVTPGSPVEEEAPAVAPHDGPRIDADAAAAAAASVVPTGTVVAVILPAVDDPTAGYTVWVADGLDSYAHSNFPGNVGVAVDPYTAVATPIYGAVGGRSIAQNLWESWSFPLHTGEALNGWWRILWFVFGMAPIALAVTGVSTWLVRRRTRRRRLQHTSTVTPDPVTS